MISSNNYIAIKGGVFARTKWEGHIRGGGRIRWILYMVYTLHANVYLAQLETTPPHTAWTAPSGHGQDRRSYRPKRDGWQLCVGGWR